MDPVRVRLIDRDGEFFGNCELLPFQNSTTSHPRGNILPEVIAIKGWLGRVFVRDRKNDFETDVSIVPCYREQSFGWGESFHLRSGA